MSDHVSTPKILGGPTSRRFSSLAASSVIDQAIAVLPVAAIEQHGPHLPVSVNTTLVNGVIEAAVPHLSTSLPVLFMPTQLVDIKSNEHICYPGTLMLSAQTLINVWIELSACVTRNLRNAHDLMVFSTNWYTCRWVMP